MSNLLRMIGRRLIALPIMIFGVTILVFFVMALSPIDQAYSVLGENATEAQVQQYREDHGLNDPILVQYGNYMVGLAQGDLGTYGANNASVAERIGAGAARHAPAHVLRPHHRRGGGGDLGRGLGAVPRPMARPDHPRVLHRLHRHPVVLAGGPHDPLVLVDAARAAGLGSAAPAWSPTPADGSHAWRCRPSRWACRFRPADARHPHVHGGRARPRLRAHRARRRHPEERRRGPQRAAQRAHHAR